MSDDKMPEKIWIDNTYWYSSSGVNLNQYKYILADGERVTELQRQNVALKAQLSAQPSRAQIAREFIKEVRGEHHKNTSHYFTVRMYEVLQQWEAEVTDNE